ncbi:hemolysin family protein [Paracoccus sp. Z118]|uniref:hemolysin family protein n=1 Tax=Paracoccus sp. Z118 TaxID=2851017 RepID=UPI001C2B7895|nr:hemolysin family protein [Paracoccus sp. Z118]MBV0892494.1 hemolysin family protein [Paracoccus sp. Z118]
MILEILFILVLTGVNGLLAMSELAVVSSRPARLQSMAEKGDRGAQVALDLLAHPGKFLSAVQVGITLVGVLTGAVSGATLGVRAAAGLVTLGVPYAVAQTLGVFLVVAAITALSVIMGELVPKQIAMSDPERIATRIAPGMRRLARIASPLVWFLDTMGRLVLRLLRVRDSSDRSITDEEVRMTIAEATQAGVLMEGERGMIAGVMRVADRSARAMMTPRRDVEMIDVNDPPETVLEKARAARFSRLPVTDGSADEILGVVALRDLIGVEKPDLRPLIREAPTVLDAADALSVVEVLRATPSRMVLVYDEYGHFQGIITAMDLLEAITGDFVDPDGDEPDIVQRADGSWLVAGSESADEFGNETGFPVPEGDFATVAGMVLAIINRIPRTGDTFTHDGWTVEIADMDAMRIDRLIVTAPVALPA